MYAILNSVQVHYEILGDGDPILMTHGWSGSSESLRALGIHLSATNKVILVDLPGFGKSSNPNENWGVEEYSDMLIELLLSLKIKKVTYFGHSFGGALGLVTATNNPRIISALILCNSALKRASKKVKIALFIKSILFSRKNFRIWVNRTFLPNAHIAKSPHLMSSFKKIMQTDLSHLPKLVKIRTLIICGGKDTFTPVAWARELKKQIPNSTLKIFQNAGHGLPLRNPEIVSDEIYRFMNSSS